MELIPDGGRPRRIAESEAHAFAAAFEAVIESVTRDVFGKDDEIRLALTCLFSRGHLLLEDYPGVAKTSLAKALATAIGGSFGRIQFTADLLPSDVTGGSVYRQGAVQEFEFRPGPVFTNILLADEINRAAPRTQAALLEAMAEYQVTVEGTTRALSPPFVCIATQNPIEMYGTYALPEAQLDRFTMRLSLGYPDVADEARAIEWRMAGHVAGEVRNVLAADEFHRLTTLAGAVYVAPAARDYVARISAATRNEAGRSFGIRVGVSPRGSIALASCAAVRAAARGDVWVTDEDIVELAVPVLAHRIVLENGDDERAAAEDLVRKVVDSVPLQAGPLDPPVS
jgi:MoxR-like ATPase